ncbi:MAG TPA: toll/interleukin-1 receptor domain-containing protein, partial [Anaerolineales bacterium]|nr:toll/interleukin-1 receptor domain-containing protein [Anaerolineales bacterium]
MPEPRPLRVFLCHASNDKPIVRELYQKLRAEDWIQPWLDEEKLSLGQHWATGIEEALDSSDIVIIFLSKNSVQKEGFIQRELNYAWELSLEKPRHVIFLIPFRLDDCEVPRYLRSRQWGDYFGGKKEATYQNLVQSLK